VSDGNTPIADRSDGPYLSLVVTARNDGHGGNLLGRMQAFVNCWITQARRYRIPSELVIVEWNPPADRPRLAEALNWDALRQAGEPSTCEVRFVEVPPELHRRYAHAAALPLYQMIAKNAGIRRARGRFVLATNVDILVSSELARFLATRPLDRGRMYRIDRHDAMSEMPLDAPVEDQLAYCATHLLRINRREGTYPVSPEGSPLLGAGDVASPGSGILFGRGWFPVEGDREHEAFRWAEDSAEVLLEGHGDSGFTLSFEIEPALRPGNAPLNLQILNTAGQELGRASLSGHSLLRLSLSGPGLEKIRFQTEAAPASELDPRSLSFRVFRVQRVLSAQADERRSPGGASPAALLSVTPIRQRWKLWARLQLAIHAAASSGPSGLVTVRLPAWVRRLSQHYVEAGGLAGMARKALRVRPFAAKGANLSSAKTDNAGPVFLHTNACGDFTLMAREHWFDLRAYPELDVFSMNLDMLFCYTAHSGGVIEEMLTEPMRVYHLEHESSWTPEGHARLSERLAARGIPVLSHQTVLGWAAQMRRLNCPMIFNREDWGLAGHELKETVVAALKACQVGGGPGTEDDGKK
jgi:hypothetical protein